jgi:hypothetical protein
VVKLFNVIQQSQAATATTEAESKASRGSGKPSLPAPTIDNKIKGKGKRGKKVEEGTSFLLFFKLALEFLSAIVNKDDFFDMIRSGGVVSTS